MFSPPSTKKDSLHNNAVVKGLFLEFLYATINFSIVIPLSLVLDTNRNNRVIHKYL